MFQDPYIIKSINVTTLFSNRLITGQRKMDAISGTLN